jgi:hypothetical protein
MVRRLCIWSTDEINFCSAEANINHNQQQKTALSLFGNPALSRSQMLKKSRMIDGSKGSYIVALMCLGIFVIL